MCGTGHVHPVDLDDLVPGLQAAIAGDEAVLEHFLDDNTAEGRVRAADNCDSE